MLELPSAPKCKFCNENVDVDYGKELTCLMHCDVSENGKHVPDPKSFALVDEYDEGFADGYFVFDCYCLNCSQSGSIGFSLNDWADDINW